MPTEARSARDVAARLIAHARTDGRASAKGAVGVAATALHRASDELSRWIGGLGCRALLTRALRQAQADHPALAGVGVASGLHPRLDRLTESVGAHGAKEIAAGLEAALVVLFELLGRLIGDDLSAKLADQSMSHGVPDDAKPEGDRSL